MFPGDSSVTADAAIAVSPFSIKELVDAYNKDRISRFVPASLMAENRFVEFLQGLVRYTDSLGNLSLEGFYNLGNQLLIVIDSQKVTARVPGSDPELKAEVNKFGNFVKEIIQQIGFDVLHQIGWLQEAKQLTLESFAAVLREVQISRETHSSLKNGLMTELCIVNQSLQAQEQKKQSEFDRKIRENNATLKNLRAPFEKLDRDIKEQRRIAKEAVTDEVIERRYISMGYYHDQERDTDVVVIYAANKPARIAATKEYQRMEQQKQQYQLKISAQEAELEQENARLGEELRVKNPQLAKCKDLIKVHKAIEDFPREPKFWRSYTKLEVCYQQTVPFLLDKIDKAKVDSLAGKFKTFQARKQILTEPPAMLNARPASHAPGMDEKGERKLPTNLSPPQQEQLAARQLPPEGMPNVSAVIPSASEGIPYFLPTSSMPTQSVSMQEELEPGGVFVSPELNIVQQQQLDASRLAREGVVRGHPVFNNNPEGIPMTSESKQQVKCDERFSSISPKTKQKQLSTPSLVMM